MKRDLKAAGRHQPKWRADRPRTGDKNFKKKLTRRLSMPWQAMDDASRAAPMAAESDAG